jgi:hypothetical protein
MPRWAHLNVVREMPPFLEERVGEPLCPAVADLQTWRGCRHPLSDSPHREEGIPRWSTSRCGAGATVPRDGLQGHTNVADRLAGYRNPRHQSPSPALFSSRERVGVGATTLPQAIRVVSESRSIPESGRSGGDALFPGGESRREAVPALSSSMTRFPTLNPVSRRRPGINARATWR